MGPLLRPRRSLHFFKIILQDTIRSGKLVVPKRFARKYGADLPISGVVLLKVPTGDTWEVELRRGDDGAVCLHKGWLDFANFYYIRYGHFLVFEYLSRSSNMFDVIVFDKSATEIEYPVRSQVTLSPVKVEDIDEDDDNEVEPIPKVQRTTGSRRSNRNRANKTDKKITRGLELKHWLFVSGYPFFQVVMSKSSVSCSILTIPVGFTRQHINTKHKEQMATLKVGGRSWPTKVVITRPQPTKAVFSGGFKAFARGNSLKETDLCTFELIQRDELVFRVSIRRSG